MNRTWILTALFALSFSPLARAQDERVNEEGARNPLETAAAALDLECEFPVVHARSFEGMESIEIGMPRRPRIVLVPEAWLTGDERMGEWSAVGGGALEVSREIATECTEGTLQISVLANGPRDTIAPGDPTEARRNFPTGWDEARVRFGDAAGRYPARHPRVRTLVRWLHDQPRLAGVVVVGSGQSADARPAPGSLAAFVEHGLGARLVICHEGGVSAALDEVARSLPRLRVEAPVATRIGEGAWRVDVEVVNVGDSPTADRRHVEARRGHGLEAVLDLGQRDWLVASCSRFEPSTGSRRSLRIDARDGSVRLDDLAPGESHRISWFVSRGPGADDDAAATEPTVRVRIDAPRAVVMGR